MSQLIFLQKSVFNYSLFVHNFIKVATVKKLITIKIQSHNVHNVVLN